MNVLAILVILGFMARPEPAPQLKVIETIKTSNVCTALRKNVATAVSGMIANNTLVQQGGFLFQKARRDAAVDPKSFAATGGAGDSSQYDDFQLLRLVSALSQNVEVIQKQLDDPAMAPKDREPDARLVRVRRVLLDVLSQQKAELNVLSGEAESNMATDLQSRHDPLAGTDPHIPNTKRVSYADELQLAVDAEAASERKVVPEITVLVNACR